MSAPMSSDHTGAQAPPAFMPYPHQALSEAETLRHSKNFYDFIHTRRSVRHFSSRSVPQKVIHYALKSASCAPSGANKQPWTFCVVSSAALKKKIRIAAEQEEHKNYHGRMSDTWLKDLEALGTNEKKPFLEDAPYLIVVFKRIYESTPQGDKHQNYYVSESVGLACGFLLVALHRAGLVALTHTPSPMNFLQTLLQRKAHEKPFLLIPVGYPAEEAQVPRISRKKLEDIAVFYA